jgi:hypothetical protein
MGWLTTSNTDYVITESKTFPVRLSYVDGDGVTHVYFRDVTSQSKYAGGMTKATAETAATSYKTANPSAEVGVQRETESGSYRITITEDVYPSWEEEE